MKVWIVTHQSGDIQGVYASFEDAVTDYGQPDQERSGGEFLYLYNGTVAATLEQYRVIGETDGTL